MSRLDGAAAIGPGDRRTVAAPAALYLLAAAVAIAASLAAAGLYGRFFFDRLLDPDSWARAVLLRHAIATGDFVQALTRDASGAGTSIHWSRLLEALAMPFVLALRPFLGLERAVIAVGAMVGPVSLGGLAAALCWAAAPFVRWRPALMFTIAATVTAPVLANYGSLGVFGHHVAIAACVVMACGHAARACRRREAGVADAVGAGMWCGVAAWFSVEAAPLAALPLGGLALAWILDGDRLAGRRLQGAALAAFAVVAFAWFVDRPNGGLLAIEPDRLSLPFVVLLALYVAATAVLSRLAPATATGRGLALLALGGLLGGLWLAAFPQFTRGLGQFMSPEVKRLLWDNINEMKGAASPLVVLEADFGGVVGLLALLVATIAARAEPRRFVLLLYATLCAAALLGLGIESLRFSAYGACLGAVMIAVIASRLEAARGLVPAAAAATALLIFVPVVVGAAAPSPRSAKAAPAAAPCPIAAAAGWLDGEPGVVLASINDSPELLWRSRVMTVASLYHRGGAAQARWLAAARAVGDDAAAAALDAAKVDFVLLCPAVKGERSPFVADLPETALERWQRGRLPAWLTPLRTDPASRLTLLRRHR